MNAAKFKTIRQSTGLSSESLSEILGVQPRSVQRWETGQHDIPDFAIEKLEELHKLFLKITNEQIKNITSLLNEYKKSGDVVLLRYKKEDFEKWNPDFENLGEGFHAAISTRIFDFLKSKKIDVNFVFFDESSYLEFLEKENKKDNRANRSAWASLHQ